MNIFRSTCYSSPSSETINQQWNLVILTKSGEKQTRNWSKFEIDKIHIMILKKYISRLDTNNIMS